MLAAAVADPALRQRLPEDFSLYLGFVHAENTRRNHALRRQLAQAAASLNASGIEPLLLKGAIRLVDGLYPELGWRFMRDLDILIPRDCLRQAVACLASLGYRFTGDTAELPPQHRHLPPLDQGGAVAVVEIHTDLLNLREVMPAEYVLARSRLVDFEGARVRVPDAADQLGHLLGHDRFDGNLRSGLFLLRSVFESALLCQDEGAFRGLLGRLASNPLARYARVRLALAARLFPDVFAPPLAVGLHDSMLARALLRLEQLDENGRLRRLFGYGSLQLHNLLWSAAWRRQLTTDIRSADFRREHVQRLRQLWSGD